MEQTLDPITHDHKSGPEKRMAIFGVGDQFDRSPSESFGGAGLRWSLLGLKVAVEINHQSGGAGRVDLPLARYRGGSAGDE